MKNFKISFTGFTKNMVIAFALVLLSVSSSFAQRSLSTGRDLPTVSNPLGQGSPASLWEELLRKSC